MILGDIMYGDDTPQRQIADLPPDAEGLIKQSYDEAMAPDNGKYGVVGTPEITGNIDDAIKQKYRGLVGERLQDYNLGDKINARSRQLGRIKVAQNAVSAKQQVSADIYAKNLENHRAVEAARAAALSSILGFAGQMAGYELGANANKKASVDFTDSPMQVKGDRPKSNMGERGNMNDSPGMTRSMNYLADIEGAYA